MRERDGEIVASYTTTRDTMEAIGKRWGITRERVRQILAKSGVNRHHHPTQPVPAKRTAPTPISLWLAKVRIPDTLGGCWGWNGYLDPAGYGRMSSKRTPGANGYAHRFSYIYHRGPIAPGMVIDHLCRNRGCVNPDHLEVVPQQENLARGVGTLVALNATKTHCPHGHPYSGENLALTQRGYRRCRECSRVAVRGWRARKKPPLDTGH